MRELFHAGRTSLLIAAISLLTIPATVLAQDQNPASLTLQDVKDRLNQDKTYLEQAQKSGKAGDAVGLQTAVDNYTRSTDGLNKAFSAGQFNGTPEQQQEALSRVSDATSKGTKTLTGLLNKVPAQAQPAIQRAIAESQKGHDTAVANLQGFHTEHPNLGQSAGMGQATNQAASHSGAAAGSPAGGRPSGRPGRP
jgi:hypothetical protein